MTFPRLEASISRARPQYDPNGSAEDSRDVLKELAIDMMRALSTLVSEAGGDASEIEAYQESLVDDLDRCFAGIIERSSEPDFVDVFRPRYGLVRELVRGATLLAAE